MSHGAFHFYFGFGGFFLSPCLTSAKGLTRVEPLTFFFYNFSFLSLSFNPDVCCCCCLILIVKPTSIVSHKWYNSALRMENPLNLVPEQLMRMTTELVDWSFARTQIWNTVKNWINWMWRAWSTVIFSSEGSTTNSYRILHLQWEATSLLVLKALPTEARTQNALSSHMRRVKLWSNAKAEREPQKKKHFVGGKNVCGNILMKINGHSCGSVLTNTLPPHKINMFWVFSLCISESQRKMENGFCINKKMSFNEKELESINYFLLNGRERKKKRSEQQPSLMFALPRSLHSPAGT